MSPGQMIYSITVLYVVKTEQQLCIFIQQFIIADPEEVLKLIFNVTTI